MNKSSNTLMNPSFYDAYSEFRAMIAFDKCSYASIIMCDYERCAIYEPLKQPKSEIYLQFLFSYVPTQNCLVKA